MIADHVLTEEKFSVLSTEFMLHKAWAFDKTHYALFDPILQDDECRIGGMQVHKISQV